MITLCNKIRRHSTKPLRKKTETARLAATVFSQRIDLAIQYDLLTCLLSKQLLFNLFHGIVLSELQAAIYIHIASNDFWQHI